MTSAKFRSDSIYPICLTHPSWKIKEEVFEDQVSEDWSKILQRLYPVLQIGDYVPCVHQHKVDKLSTESGNPYLLATIETKILKHSYTSYSVWSEDETKVVTGNFWDKDLAILWIEAILG